MRSTPLVLALAVLVTSMPGHSQEFRVRRDQLQEQLTWGLPSLNEQVLPRIDDQFETRDKAIAEVRKNHLQNGSTSNLEEQPKWQNSLQRAAEDQQRAFTDIAALAIRLIEQAAQRNEAPLDYIVQLREEVPQQVLAAGSNMVAFHATLKGTKVAGLRDQLIRNRYNYQEEIDNLTDKLRTIESNDDSIDSTTASQRTALLNACQALSRRKTEAERDLSRLAQTLAEAETLDQAEDAGDDLIEEIDEIAEALEDFRDNVDDAIDGMDSAFDREWAIVTVFSEARKAVKEFEAKNNYESALRAFNDVQSESLAAGGQLKHDGDQTDLRAVVTFGMGDVQRHLNDFKGDYDEFEDAFEGSLLGPTSSVQNERLAEFAAWDDWADDVSGCAPVEILNNMSRSEQNAWGADPRRISDEATRRAALRALDDARRRLDQAIGATMEQARRLVSLAQLDDRKRMRDALSRS
jgi:hypothetical protein